jgi:hypothetical protein
MRALGFSGPVVIGLNLLVASTATAGPAPEATVKLLDMFAKALGDQVTVYIQASGDISQFKSSRKLREDSYILTLDVPALAPVDSKYDLRTPFTRRFEVWPMKLGNQYYSRLVMELDREASSVIGRDGTAQIYIKISRKQEPALAEAAPEETVPASPGEPVPEVQNQPAPENGPRTPATSAPETQSASAPSQTVESSEYFNLFPATAGESRRPVFLLPPVAEEGAAAAGTRGIRLGRFLFQPLVDATYVWGDNLLLQSQEPLKDSALLLRGRAAFDLLDSEQSLQIVYDVTYRKFKEFELIQDVSHFVNLEAGLVLSPRMQLDLGNHFARGSFESHEIDPGRELFFSVDPFFRNDSRAVLRYDFSERLGLKVLGSYNHLQFVHGGSASFYDYDTVTAGASFLYQVSALTSLFGEYRRAVTPEPLNRPEAGSIANSFFFGITGEITPVLVGTAQAGYQLQEFGPELERTRYRGLVAEVSLTRSFSEVSQLTVKGGRTTFLSNFANNGFYLSNYLEGKLTLPLAYRLRFLGEAALLDNSYPWDIPVDRPQRDDRAWSASAGLVYFFSPLFYLRGDYRHERRTSTLEDFRYLSHAFQVLVGFGFSNR